MKLAIGILGIALVLSCNAQNAATQTGTQTEIKTPVAETAPNTYRATYSLTEMDNSKQLSVQHFSLTMNPASKDGFMMRDGEIKIGSRIPIITSSSTADKPEHIEVQYQDVGLYISVRMKEFANSLQILSTFTQTALEEAPASPSIGKDDPIIRQTVLASTALLTLGKPVMIGSLDIPHSTRHLDIAVVIESVR
jgi:hypothetical protein